MNEASIKMARALEYVKVEQSRVLARDPGLTEKTLQSNRANGVLG